MKADDTIQSRFRKLSRWPLFLLPPLILVTILVFGISRYSGCLVAAFDLLYLVFAFKWSFGWRRQTEDDLAEYALGFQREQDEQMTNLPVPCAILSEDGELMWFNNAFHELLPKEEDSRFSIQDMMPSLSKGFPPKGEKHSEHIQWKSRSYEAELSMVSEAARQYSVFLFDETSHLEALKQLSDERAVIGQVCIDNYEEVMSSAEQVRQSLLAALIERKVSKYFSNYDGVVLKTEKDRFTVFLQNAGLQAVMADRFSLLEDVKALNIGNNIAVTLSISMGTEGASLEQNNEFARNAMNLALGRGGDQAIVKTPDAMKYYGGKTQKQEKNTRVKARVKAQALRELMLTRDQVLIMGHHLPDMDAFGAAVGIWKAAHSLHKTAHIVMGEISSSLRPLVDRFKNGDYPEDMIISDEVAKTLRNANTMMVVVDVNRPSYTECPALLDKKGTVVVIDHHRQGVEVIRNATLSYIEPYASSASEMVAEILQYFGDDVHLNPMEAETIYAGIVMDTDNFVAKTGVRTFEAAAFLRRQGADVTRVRKLFREKMADTQAKAATISNAEIYEGSFALGICDGTGIESPTIVGAQAANEMLDIIGVKASIVFTEYEDVVYVSARSIDEVNVQLIMERIGGGGHLSIAGAQLTGVTAEQARKKVKKVIKDMLEEGAL